MKAPRRLFRNRKPNHDVIVTTENRGREIILGDPDPADLQGYSGPIRSRWWGAYREEAIENPVVIAVHKRSRLAGERGLTGGEDFTFLAVPAEEAHRSGWPVDPARPNRPPTMVVLLATGEEVQGHFTCDLTPSGLIDAAHFDGATKQYVLREVPAADRLALSSLIERPWLYG